MKPSRFHFSFTAARASTAALALFVCGCSANTTSISAVLELDEQSCEGTDSEIMLGCTSTSVVTIYSSDNQIIAQDCVPLSVGPLQNLPRSLQDSLSLGSLPTNRPIRVDLSVYSGSVACDDPADIKSNARPYLFATTPFIILNDSSSEIALSLQCALDGTNSAGTLNCGNCYNESLACFELNNLTRCDSVVSQCVADCSDVETECQRGCELLLSFCDDVDGEAVVLRCDLENSNCQSECPDEGTTSCDQLCAFASNYCKERDDILFACYERETECRSQCEASDCLVY